MEIIMDIERNPEYDDFLDDVYPTYTIGTMVFYPSQILFDCDPIAYHIEVSEYQDFANNNEE
jgi:hypothetical protein